MRICNFYVCAISIIRNHSKNMLSFEDPVKKREQASNTFTRMISYIYQYQYILSQFISPYLPIPHTTGAHVPMWPCKSGHEAKALPIQGPHWPYCWGLSPANWTGLGHCHSLLFPLMLHTVGFISQNMSKWQKLHCIGNNISKFKEV